MQSPKTKNYDRHKIVPQPRYKTGRLWTYIVLYLAGIYAKIRYHIDFDREGRKSLKQIEGPLIILAAHQSPMDTVVTLNAIKPLRPALYASESVFYMKDFGWMLRAFKNTIPKKQFSTDTNSVRNIKKMVDAGVSVLIFPEGRQTISGYSAPFPKTISKLVKWLGLPVATVNMHGCYLTRQRFITGFRKGRMQFDTNIALTKDDIKTMTVTQIDDRLSALLAYNDYEWQEQNKVEFISQGKIYNACNYDKTLIVCPKCLKEFTLKSEKNDIFCTHCGNRGSVDNYSHITPVGDSFVFDRFDKWYDFQFNIFCDQIAKAGDDFKMSNKAELSSFDIKTRKWIVLDLGVFELTKNGMIYTSPTRTMSFPMPSPPALSMTPDLLFINLFYDDVLYEYRLFDNEGNVINVIKYNYAIDAISRLLK
jgi:1-acyl-sn-glycerol-3-phosphate acyltransferase